jgi:hypothetical protein
MRQQLIETQYNGINFHFTEDAWFNATEAADKFGKRVDNWLRTDETKEYLRALSEVLNTSNVRDLVKTKRGSNGGTWFHPRLAVAFTRWLDPKFSIWCDVQIDKLIRGTHTYHDWKKLRHEAASSFKVMNQVLDMSRQAEGKETKPHHYSNEAKLINWVISGEFKSLDRDQLSSEDLSLMALIEMQDTCFIAQGFDYHTRKQKLLAYAQGIRQKKITH